VLLIAMTGVLGVETLLPVFATGTWHAGPAGCGLLRMAPGIAGVLAGLGLSMFPGVGRGAVTIGIAFAGADRPYSTEKPVVRTEAALLPPRRTN
jgi:hypothetical protein